MVNAQANKQLRMLIDARERDAISWTEYRAKRKQLLDTLDKNLNGVTAKVAPAAEINQLTTASDSEFVDKTQPYFSGKLSKCFGFLKGNNE